MFERLILSRIREHGGPAEARSSSYICELYVAVSFGRTVEYMHCLCLALQILISDFICEISSFVEPSRCMPLSIDSSRCDLTSPYSSRNPSSSSSNSSW
jgi:hypothetical protein